MPRWKKVRGPKCIVCKRQFERGVDYDFCSEKCKTYFLSRCLICPERAKLAIDDSGRLFFCSQECIDRWNINAIHVGERGK